jgi:predicted AlkP superfamily phosphohydrolase/phosphomutase
MSFPPERVNGVLVAGRDTPGLRNTFTYPPDVKEELESALDSPYIIVPDDWRWIRRGKPGRARDELLREVDVRFAAVQHLMQTREWDFCMFVVGATDGASHFFWHLHDPAFPCYDPALAERLGDVLLEVYQRVDENLQELEQMLPDDAHVVVVSDHGSGGRELRAIHLNLWLARHGWLCIDVDRDSEGRAGSWVANGLSRLKGVAYSLLPYQYLNRLRRVWPDRWRRRLSRHELFAGVDWSHTRAFSEERRGNIWINLRGREPQGIVEPGAEYEELRSEIINALESTEDPETGAPVVRRVWRREELFEGPYVEHIPDLLVETESPAQFMIHKDHNSLPFRTLTEREIAALTVTGDHRMEGTIVLHGPGIQPRSAVVGTTMCDVLPTVLYLMDEPIPAYVEGRVIREAFRSEWFSRTPPHWEECEGTRAGFPSYSYTEDETREIEERLAGLGYLG